MSTPSTQDFELVVVTKGPATEAQASGLIAENQLVADGSLHTIQPVLAASPLTVAMDMVRADMVFSDWLDVFERLPEGQTITLWSVIANDDGSLFMHSFVGVIDNARLPRACKIDRKG